MKSALLLLLLAFSVPAPAQESGTPAAPEKSAPGKPPALDERIAALADVRDPFWPPGYKPGGTMQAVAGTGTDDLDLLAQTEGGRLNHVGRLKVGNKYFLMQKGRAVGQGDIIEVTGKNGKAYRMRIIAISQDNIQLEPVGH
jgi:hypothetical protein